jgi:hypothetical protein
MNVETLADEFDTGRDDEWPAMSEADLKPVPGDSGKIRELILKPSVVKAIIRREGKRCSPDFINLLNRMVIEAVVNLAQMHNGGTKTLRSDLLEVMPIKATCVAASGLVDKKLAKRRKVKRG